MLFAVTAILSSFMLSGELPAIRGWLRRTVRPAWLEKLQTLGGHVRTTLGGWLRAQLKLMGITFLILNAGLLLLAGAVSGAGGAGHYSGRRAAGVRHGTILIPWALALFLQGETKTGIGLVILYGAAALSRQALEPRLVGKQVGLNPVLTLLALYTGYRLLGVGGMIVFPIAAMLFKQLWDHSGLQPDG
ncbi:MAG: AI-2E family transporter [Acutalibacteraceae bacterium]